MMRATDLAHLMMERTLRPGDVAVDATAGNGHDTLFLAELVGPTGWVIGLDIQQAALDEAARRTADLKQVTLLKAGHERLAEQIAALFPEAGSCPLAGVMFNLGYLPGGDKQVTTRAETTIAALDQALALLKPGGLVSLVLYPGHPEGAGEAEAVRVHAEGLPDSFTVSRYRRVNTRRPAPELVAIERVG
ncbi:MAG TPA: class I SAM-dependent methyltransferase [Afifellaceae bacterium]|nr:class I SAM-dependent methyltransferase [Afifellaceae bacterium]